MKDNSSPFSEYSRNKSKLKDSPLISREAQDFIFKVIPPWTLYLDTVDSVTLLIKAQKKSKDSCFIMRFRGAANGKMKLKVLLF